MSVSIALTYQSQSKLKLTCNSSTFKSKTVCFTYNKHKLYHYFVRCQVYANAGYGTHSSTMWNL